MSGSLKLALVFSAGAAAMYAFVKYQDRILKAMGSKGV